MTEWRVIPSIRVPDLAKALEFYTGPLGFELTRGTAEEGNCSLARNDARIMLESAHGFYSPEYNAAIKDRIGTASAVALYIQARDLNDFYQRLQAAGAKIVDPLADRPWGQREFTVADQDGHWLTFWDAEDQGSS